MLTWIVWPTSKLISISEQLELEFPSTANKNSFGTLPPMLYFKIRPTITPGGGGGEGEGRKVCKYIQHVEHIMMHRLQHNYRVRR